MITPERIYEVFGFEDNSNLNNWHFHFEDGEFYIYEASPEMLVALVNEVIFIEKISGKPYADRNVMDKQRLHSMIKAIESADSQGRKWIEIKKELENTDG